MFGKIERKILDIYFQERLKIFNFIPIIIGAGILYFFALPTEPSPKKLIGIFSALILITASFWKNYLFRLLIIIPLLFSGGLLIAKIRTDAVEAYQLDRNLDFVKITAKVESVSLQDNGYRLVLTDLDIPYYELPGKLEKVRILARTNTNGAEAGDRIALKVSLKPLSLPILPDSYDFARLAYFKQIGAVGFAVSPIEILSKEDGFVKSKLASFRQKYVAHLTSTIGMDTGSIASALIIGEYGGLDKDILTKIRESGLAHILAVSGLHISLVMGIFFLTTRKIISFFPYFAETMHTKKIAAILAIIGSYCYLLLSGEQIAATRAFIMGLVIAIAVLLDRTVNPLRSLAVAATIIILIYPEALINVSFHLSFAAVFGLITCYKIYQNYIAKYLDNQNILLKLPVYIISLSFSSLVATLATAPFSIYHFNQFSSLGVLSNLLAIPLTSFFLMPMCVLSFFLYPLHLDYYALKLLNYGLEFFIWIGTYFSSFSISSISISYISSTTILLYTIAIIWLALFNTKIRRYSLGFFLLAILSLQFDRAPDMVIDPNKKLVAAVNNEGQMQFSKNRFSKFQKKTMLSNNGEKIDEEVPFTKLETDECNKFYCSLIFKNTKILINFEESEFFDCAENELLLDFSGIESAKRNKSSCYHNFQAGKNDQYSTISLYFDNDSIKIIPTIPNNIRRKWYSFYKQ